MKVTAPRGASCAGDFGADVAARQLRNGQRPACEAERPTDPGALHEVLHAVGSLQIDVRPDPAPSMVATSADAGTERSSAGRYWRVIGIAMTCLPATARPVQLV
jgi:hypothetical protein